MLTWSITTDAIFTTLVLALMLSMRKPAKGQLKSVFQNTSFWIFVLFWFKTLLTIGRLPVHYLGLADPRVVTIWFNVSGSWIISVSCVVPLQWILHFRKLPKGSFVQLPMQNRFKFCILVSGIYAMALLVSMAVIGGDLFSASDVLFWWRIFFFVNSTLEATLLVGCLFVIRRAGGGAKETMWKLKLHIWTTVYMRAGIAGTIVLKFVHALPEQKLGSVHLFFIFTGLTFYRLRSVRMSLPKLAAFRKTEQILVFEDAQGTNNSHEIFRVIQQRLSHGAPNQPAHELLSVSNTAIRGTPIQPRVMIASKDAFDSQASLMSEEVPRCDHVVGTLEELKRSGSGCLRAVVAFTIPEAKTDSERSITMS